MVNSLKRKLVRPYYQLRDFGCELRANHLSSNYHLGLGYKRIYHYHIRKTAGTSLNSSFWNLAGLNLKSVWRKQYVFRKNFVFVNNSNRSIERGNYFFATSHTPSHKLLLPPKTYTIAVLRDPVSRVLSYYKYLSWIRTSEAAKTEDPYWKETYRETRFLGDSFHDFLNQLPSRHLCSQLFMFSESYNIEEALDRILNCSQVIFTENFSSGIDRLGKDLNLPLQEQKERRFKYNLSIKLSNSEQDRLCEMLSGEIDFIDRLKKIKQLHRS